MLPEHAPFSPDQRRAVDIALAGLDAAQRFWLAGFLSAGAPVAAAKAAPVASSKLTILYGTESGNSEKLADLSAKEAKKKGFQTAVKNMSEISPADLAKLENLLVIVSTWGDGEPPETATSFYKQLMNGEAVALPKLRYSVCALGDTAYEKFCQTGKDIDARLETLGGSRVSPRQDCDVEYEEPYQAWLKSALGAFAPSVEVATAVVEAAPAVPAVEYGKKNPFPGELLEKVLLNGKGTSKETWHYEISLEGSGLAYEPGDALAVIPVNAPDLVEGILKASKLSGAETVEVKGVGPKILADALREDLDITALSRAVLTKLQALSGSDKLAALLADDAKDQLKDYLWGRWISDALEDFSNGVSAADLVTLFRKLPPRLYSIASSPLAHPGEVHLTVASVRYQAHGRQRKGVASTYLADIVKKGEVVPVYTHHNKNFRLPASADTPVIMVGPGTGVAPFRSFVEHRGTLSQAGKNWLIFGDQHYTYDFLYQTEWQEHLANKALHKLDVAFSRDQPEKVYVQHRMLDQAKELYTWLQEGAHFYVCGDAARMAHDVHEALLTIVEQQSGQSREAAEAYVDELKKSKRYQRDVY